MNDSQFGGRLPIGHQLTLSDCGPSFTMGDGSVWLRSGTLTAASNAPLLARLPPYQVLGRAMTPPANPSAVLQVATDGAGTYVATRSDVPASVWRSTDGGLTWASVTVATGVQCGGVAYGSGRFVVVAQNATSNGVNLYYSANGAAWTAGATTNVGVAGAGVYVVGMRACFTGGRFVFILGRASAFSGMIFTSNDGASIASICNGGANIGDPSFDGVNVNYYVLSNGFGGVLAFVLMGSGTSYAWSADHGVTWAFYSGAGSYTSASIMGNYFALTSSASGGAVHLYAAPSSITPSPIFPSTEGSPLALFSSGNGPGAKLFAYSRQIGTVYEFAAGYGAIASTRQTMVNASIWPGGDRLFQFTAGYYYDKDFSVYDNVGIAGRWASGSSNMMVQYVRAR